MTSSPTSPANASAHPTNAPSPPADAPPVPLYAANDPTPRAYACGKCGYVFGGGSDPAPLILLAQQCCQGAKCQKCNRPVPRGMTHCLVCIEAHVEANAKAAEENRIRTAKRVPAAAWTGPVHNPAQGQSGWHANIEELRGDLLEEEMPTWVWGAKVYKLSLNAQHILESALEEASEQAAEEGSLKTSDLQKVLDAWCEASEIEWWEQDDVIVELTASAPEADASEDSAPVEVQGGG